MDKTRQLTAKLFGDRLRRMFDAKFASVRDAAEGMEMSHMTLNRYERGEVFPDVDARRAMARRLEISADDMESILNDCETEAALRANRYLTDNDIKQILWLKQKHEEDNRREMEERKRRGE